MLGQPLGESLSVRGVALHAQVQGFDAEEEEESGERAHGGAGIAQPVSPHIDDVGDVADGFEGFGENDSVIGGVGLGEFGPFGRVVGPGEFPAVDHDASDVDAVAAEEFGGGVDGDVDAVFEGPEERGSEDGIIHQDGDAVGVGNVGDGLEIGNVVAGIADRFEENQTGVVIHQLVDLFGVIGVEEADFDAEFGEGLGEEGVGAAVEAGGGDDVLAGAGDGEDGGGDGSLSAGEGEGGGATFESGHALLEDVVGGVHQTGVDETELLEREKVSGVFSVVKDVACGGEDGDGAGAGGGVGLLTGVEGQGSETWFWV